MTLKFTMQMGGSNDNYHHISANDSKISRLRFTQKLKPITGAVPESGAA
jgi:hypothetical protein